MFQKNTKYHEKVACVQSGEPQSVKCLQRPDSLP